MSDSDAKRLEERIAKLVMFKPDDLTVFSDEVDVMAQQIESAADFAQRVLWWYAAALEQMEYCPFCGMSRRPHTPRCPMKLVVERDTVFAQ